MSTLFLAFLELTFVMVFILLLHSVKRTLGAPAFYLSLGLFFVLGQIISAFGIQINPAMAGLQAGLQVDVGNAVLLAPFLVALLIVYVVDGTLEAQRVIFGFLAILFGYFYLASLTAYQCLWPGYFSDDPDFVHYIASSFLRGRRVLAASFASIAIDLFTLPIIYQFFRNRKFGITVCVLATLVFAQTIDSFVFQLLSAPTIGNWWVELRASYIARAIAMVWLSVLTSIYLHMWNLPAEERRRPLDIVFAFLGGYGRALQLQRHVREWEGRYRIVVEHSSEWIFIVNESGVILNSNPPARRRLGRRAEAGSSLRATMRMADGSEWDWDAIWRELGSRVTEEDPDAAIQQDWIAEGHSGAIHILDTQISRGVMDENEVGIVISRDVTERHRMEEERRQLQEQLVHAQRLEAVGQLAGGVAHDFNNLLHTIQGSIDGFSHYESQLGEGQRGLIGNIGDALGRAKSLTMQLLGFARKGKYRSERLDVKALMDASRALFEPGAGKNVTFRMVVTPEPMYIRGDATQLEQVLLNILINARDAVEGCEEAKIVFRAERAAEDTPGWQFHPEQAGAASGFACIRIRDNGTGIPDDVKDSIFEPFFTTKEVGKGTGMGLAMAYGCVANHGGWIHVDSAVGKGTQFFIFLPCCT